MALNHVANKLAAFYEKLEAERLNQERFYIKARLEEKINKIQEAIIPLEEQGKQSEKEYQCLVEIKGQIKKLLELANKLEEKFSIFVIGDGNAGKSTVVNALLGQAVAKMKFDPMTWKIDVFHEEDEKGVQLVNYDKKGNQVFTLSMEHAKALIDEEEAKREESIYRIQENIKEKTNMIHKVCAAQHIPYKEVANKIEAYKERIWKEELYTSSIVEAKWPVATNELLANFQIVDTPGLRQNRIASHLQDSIKKYYDEADGIIWVLDMNKVAMNSTKAYIEEIESQFFKKGKVCDQKRVVGLLNRSDCIRSSEEKEATLAQASQMYGDSFNAILPFSATMALKGRLEGDENLLEQSGYEALSHYIQTYFLKGAIEAKTQKILMEIQKEEIKFQVLISYYMQEIEEGLKGHIATKKQITSDFEMLEEESKERLSNMIMSYEHIVQPHIEKFTEVLFETKADKELLLKEEILNISQYQDEIKELLKDILKQVSRMRGQYLDKDGMNRVAEYPLENLIASFEIEKYLDFLEDDLGLEKIESHLFRKLVSNLGVVKKMVDRPYIEQCKEKLFAGLKQAVETMTTQLTDEVKISLLQERQQILKIRQRQFDEIYGDDKVRISQLYALKTIDKLLSQPTRESTVVDYIKGMGEGEWNNILIS